MANNETIMSAAGFNPAENQVDPWPAPEVLRNELVQRLQARNFIRARRQGDKYVVFNTGNATIAQVRAELRACLTPQIFNGIISIRRIQPPTGQQRIDLVINSNASSGLTRTL